MSASDAPASEPEETPARSGAPAGRSDSPPEVDDLRAEVELLRDENRALRRAYAHSRRSTYRRTALGLLAVGVVALCGAAFLPDARDVLVSLGAVGAFGAVLTYYLTPEGFIAASVGERVYAALDESARRLVDELGLSTDRVYVPTDGTAPARLYVPRREGGDPPGADALESVLVVDGDGARGVSLVPTGGNLFEEFERALVEPLGETPSAALAQLTDAVVEEFELAAGADADLDAAGGRATVRVSDDAYGGADRLDHPVASLLGVGLANALDAPITVESADGGEDLLVTCRWSADGDRRAPDADPDEGDAPATDRS